MVDVEAVHQNISIVIASNRNENTTADTAPDYAEVVVRRDEGRNVARNRGIETASNDWIVVADDDIEYPAELVAKLVQSMDEYHLAGLEDSWPFKYVITRMMIFHRTLWEEVGGFDEGREHGADTDFAMRCEKRGASILRLPRYIVPHHDKEGEFTTKEHIEWLWYLLKRNPTKTAIPASKLIANKFGLISSPRRPDSKDED